MQTQSNSKPPRRRPPNPYQPGAGHSPPFLAGRNGALAEMQKLLQQEKVLDNLLLTGLRGVGKTVLLEEFRPLAQEEGWRWTAADMTKSISVTEADLADKILIDLAAVTSTVQIAEERTVAPGFLGPETATPVVVDYPHLRALYDQAWGPVADKLKKVLTQAWGIVSHSDARGIVFAYDEAQNLADHEKDKQYPLSTLLDVFQYIQRQGIPFLLLLAGLPNLLPKLVETRTYSERMFHAIELGPLNETDSREAVTKPLRSAKFNMEDELVTEIVNASGGYPYFIQFIAREAYDAAVDKWLTGSGLQVSWNEVLRKLDGDFFAARWSRVTDRQRDLLRCIAKLPNCDREFTIEEIVKTSNTAGGKPFKPSNTRHLLIQLMKLALVHQSRHGKYSFSLPKLCEFIRRQEGHA